MSRTIRKTWAGEREDIGDLVTRRPQHRMEQLNPFLFINHHGPQVYPPRNRGLPFGPHPHRGFETVTFIVDGSLTHRDSGGHESVITAGGVQWMTAGRGVEHSETSPREFLDEGGPLDILQLWVNLPARLKMTEPRYIGLQRDDIPTLQVGEATVQLIAGSWNGVTGPVPQLSDVFLTTIDLHGRATLPAPRDRVVFLYVVRGEVNGVPQFQLIEWNDDGDTIDLDGEALLIFGHAEPLRERIAAQGPFVMNTHEEIYQAIVDYQSGRFGALR
jgi:redox-sensitive bicupin YhaK (pirin superfamily)